MWEQRFLGSCCSAPQSPTAWVCGQRHRDPSAAGFGDTPSSVPAPIRHALLLLVSHWYEHRGPIEIGTAEARIPAAVSALSRAFRGKTPMIEPRVGEMRHLLQLQAPQRTPDGSGGAVVSWALLAEIWGAVRRAKLPKPSSPIACSPS